MNTDAREFKKGWDPLTFIGEAVELTKVSTILPKKSDIRGMAKIPTIIKPIIDINNQVTKVSRGNFKKVLILFLKESKHPLLSTIMTGYKKNKNKLRIKDNIDPI